MTKQLIRGLFYLLLSFSCYAQVPTVVTAEGSLILKSKGTVSGTVDRAQFRRYKFARNGNFYLSAYINTISDKSALVGLSFRNEDNSNKVDGSLANATVGIQRDSLKVLLRKSDKSPIQLVASTANISLPVWLKIEKVGNNLVYYYSKQAYNVTSVNWTKLNTISDAFTNFKSVTQNILSPAGASIATAEIKKIGFGSVAEQAKPACDCGYSVLGVTQVANTTKVTVEFQSCSVYGMDWKLKNGSTIIKQGTITVSNSTPQIDLGNEVVSGSYTLETSATNCTGSASKSVTYSRPSLTNCQCGLTLLTVTKTDNTQGKFTFHGCDIYSMTYRIKQGNTTISENTVVPTSATINFGIPSGTPTGSYTIEAVANNCAGYSTIPFNFVNTSQSNNTSTSPVIAGDYPNVFSTVAKETGLDVSSPQKFSNIEIPTVLDTYLGIQSPTYFVAQSSAPWQLPSDYQSKGVYTPIKQWGYQSCLDTWPNTQWEAPCSSGTFETFISRLPHSKRGFMTHPVPYGNTEQNYNYYGTASTIDLYNHGRNVIGNFGLGDAVNGRSKVFASEIDWEMGWEDGSTPEKAAKVRANIKGMSDAILGYNLNLYAVCLFSYGQLNWARYPTKNDGTYDYPNNTGNPYLLSNNGQVIQLNQVWAASGDAGNAQNWNLVNTKNAIEVEEENWKQEDGLDDGIELRDVNNILKRKVSHFGVNYDASGTSGYNVTHVIAKTVHLVETGSYFAELQGRKYGAMCKVVCDAGAQGEFLGYRWNDHQFYNPSPEGSSRAYIPRHLTLMNQMMVFFNGAWNSYMWDAPATNCDLDGYNGFWGALNYIFTKKSIGTAEVSLASLRPNMKFNRWNTEVSYDNGQTWQKHKGIELKDSKDRLPIRVVYTPDGFVGVFACRPYGVEPQSCMWRVNINGTYYTGTINSTDWKSCYPEQPGRKDFYLSLTKVNTSTN